MNRQNRGEKMNDRKPYGQTMRGIVKKDGKILLVKRHPKSRHNPEQWELPGGKCEKCEYFDETLIREFKEETGLDVELGDFYDAVQVDYPHKRTVQVIIYADAKDFNVKISDEHTDFKWLGKDELLEFYEKGMITPSLKKALEKNDFEI